jgi:hypothetical protein
LPIFRPSNNSVALSATTTKPSTTTHITIKVNKNKKIAGNIGPFLNPKKVERLPSQFGPGPIKSVVRESVQNLVDASLDQKEVTEWIV